MKHLSLSTLLALLLVVPGRANAQEVAAGAAASASASASATFSVGAAPEVSVDAAAEADDILMVIDLPIAVAELRASGVEEVEITEAIEGAAELGVSAGAATEVLVAEKAEVKGRGHKKGFGLYVKALLIQGFRGKALADKIHERKDDFKLSDAERDELKAQLKAKRDEEKARRKAIHDKRKEFVKAGKKIRIDGEDIHAELEKLRKAAKKAHEDKGLHKGEGKGLHKGEGKGHEGKGLEAKIEAREEKLEKREDRLDKLEAKVEKAEAKADASGDAKAEAKLDKLEAKLDKREEKLEKREEKLDKLEAKAEEHKKGKGSK